MAKKRQGYYAVVLDEKSSNALKALAVHPVVHCHHLTLAFNPDIGDHDDICWSRYIGGILDLYVTGMAKDDRGQAVFVPKTPSSNKFPHVTVSCAEGTPPVYSNELLERVAEEGRLEPMDMKLTGIIRFVSFGRNKSGSK